MDGATSTKELTTGPLVVKIPKCCEMLDASKTRIYELIAAKELESILDGKLRKITVASIHAYIARRLEVEKAAA
jgi:excisionase family DNA binding protein